MGASPPALVADLVERFSRDRKVFQSPDYKEEQLRAEFLNPFFESLGWDVANKAGLTEVFKPVIHEESIKVAGATKAPDYTFRIGGRRVFFAEAKKPAVNIAEDASPAFQLRRYAWTSKLPVSLLSDFDQFAVYDCRIQPHKTDKPTAARTMLLGYTDYLGRWDELLGLFSPDAIQKGSLDRYVETSKSRKGTSAVDDAFLAEIEKWRDMLARNIALRNPRLSTRELNFAVQRTIDRLIFLRICEDRGIEHYAFLQSLMNGERVYPRLVKHFRDADDRYNSGLFHFGEEKDRAEAPDKLTLELDIDDKPLKEIIGSLYYPDCPYEFSVLPADILGQVYEQFLGKVIRLTAGHQAKVEEKPEVRKAGGVYYTPTYIVDYIVKNTVGKLLEGSSPQPSPQRGEGGDSLSLERERARVRVNQKQGLTPEQASRLRILDPACGSGSFLLGAYQYLLDWHLTYYIEHPPSSRAPRTSSPLYRDGRGNYRLTTAERKRILLNSIYGVDIDSQAVEVTKLSLLLKVLEGENQETLQNQLKFFHERALPDLGSNIKCGNSLIGSDFYQGEQQALFTDEEQRARVNVFDWDSSFSEIMASGGFDAVIGNPPYDVISAREQERPVDEVEAEKDYYRKREHLRPALGDKLNYYRLFVAQSLTLVRGGGLHGFIVPMGMLADAYARPLRELVLNRFGLVAVEAFPQKDNPHDRVFRYAKLPTCAYVLSRPKAYSASARFTLRVHTGRAIDTETPLVRLSPLQIRQLAPEQLSIPVKQRCTSGEVELAVRLGRSCVPLSRYAASKQGEVNVTTHKEFVRWFEAKPKRVPKGLTEVLRGAYVNRYMLHAPKQGGYYYVDRQAFVDSHQRSDTKAADHKLRRIGYQRGAALDNWRRIIATEIPVDAFCADTVNYIVDPQVVALEFILGVLNSALLEWRFRLTSATNHVNSYEINSLPFPHLEPSRGADKARHDKMVELVKRMLDLHKQLPKAKTPHEQESLKRTIAATDNQIDALVYELYGLTDDEIRIVDGGRK